MVRETTNRQFSLLIETGGTSALNLRYQDGWFAFAGGWGSPIDLGSIIPSKDQNGDGDCDDAGDTKNVYHMRVTGHLWGTPSATYDLALSDANGVAFTSLAADLVRYQNPPTSATPIQFKFSTEFGSNPGFWIDDVSSHNAPGADSGEIVSFVANGNTLSWETTNPGPLTLDPGNIDVTGLTSFEVNPGVTTTYTLTTETASADFTIGVDEVRKPVLINEFLAINPGGDDWVELFNPNSYSINLDDWSLTDNPLTPEEFVFPPTAIDPNGYLIISASALDFSLSGSGEYLGLYDPQGNTSDEYAPTFPLQYPGVSYGHLPTGGPGYFGIPSPAAENIPSPFIADYQALTQADQSIVVSAFVSGNTLASVELAYRTMFGAETLIDMTDLGGGNYQAIIPNTTASPGEMLRWRIVARDTAGAATVNPPYPDPLFSPRYHGTVIPDPALSSQLPILQWFLPSQSISAADTRNGTRCSVFWQGEFYDNILVHLRGATTAGLEKKPHQFEFNPGHNFQIAPGIPRVDQINLNAAYPDSSYIRDILPMENLWKMGAPAPETFPVRVELNGAFHSLGIMIEQPDNEYLERRNELLDGNGPLYKATGNGSWLISSSGFEARNNSDLSDLADFTRNLNGSNQLDFLLENVDLPSVVNYLAVNVVDSIFNPQKNYYVHRNKFGEWMILPWDRDFSYGHRWLGGGDPRGSAGPAGFLIADERYEWGGSHHDFKGGYNRFFNAIFANPETSEMFYRRLRTTIDTVLAPGVLESRLEEFRTLMKQEADLDRAKWGFTNDSNYRRFPRESFDLALDRIKNTYLPQRRTFLETDGGSPSRGTLPSAHSAAPAITFGTIVTDPASGDQDEESIELLNPNTFAVDLSNWQISGGVSHTLRAGTVIPANGSLVLSPDIQLYRSLNTPGFAQGNYSGHLSNFSEPLTLSNEEGTIVASITTPNTPSDNQIYLRISEIMYHPVSDENAEFIELYNSSDNVTLTLDGVAFTDGIEYVFPSGTSLAPGGRIVIRYPDFLSGRLSNKSDTLKLEDANGSTIQEFTYSDSAPWPALADGEGRSLVYRNGDPDRPESWRPSLADGGNPGTSDSRLYLSGSLTDYSLSESIRFDPSTMVLTTPRKPGADSVSVVPEWSSDLQNWDSGEMIYLGDDKWLFAGQSPSKTTFFRVRIQLP